MAGNQDKDTEVVGEWLMLDDEQWTAGERLHLLKGKKNFARWGQLPEDAARIVKRLCIIADSPARDELPENIASLTGLEHLEIGKRFLKKLKPGVIPPSVTALRILGDGSATW